MKKLRKKELERLIYIVMFIVCFIFFWAVFFAQTAASLLVNANINNVVYTAVMLLGDFLMDGVFAFVVGSAVAALAFLGVKYTLIQFKLIKNKAE